MNNEITYRIAQEKDFSAILKLYNTEYSSNRSLEEYLWLVNNNPAGKAIIFIALIGEEVVGMRALIPYSFLIGGQSFNTYKTEESLTSNEHRKKGIFRKLNELLYAHDANTLKWGLSHQIEVLRKLGLSGSHQVTPAIYLSQKSGAMKSAGIGVFSKKGIYLTLQKLRQRIFRKNTSISNQTLSLLSHSETKTFIIELSKANPNRYYPNLDEEYLIWRLQHNPYLKNPQIWGTKDAHGNITCISITGRRDSKGLLLGTYTKNEVSKATKRQHLLSIIAQLEADGLRSILTWSFDCNQEVEALGLLMKEVGFIPLRKGLYIHQNSSELDTSNIYFSPILGIK